MSEVCKRTTTLFIVNLPRSQQTPSNIIRNNALLKGKKDGEVIIRNIRPKLTGGKREVIDETFRDTASFKETDEGSFKE